MSKGLSAREISKVLEELIWKAELEQKSFISLSRELAKLMQDRAEVVLVESAEDLIEELQEDVDRLEQENKRLRGTVGDGAVGDRRDYWGPASSSKVRWYSRLVEWEKFSDQIRRHIVQYTTVQYGNKEGHEQVDEFSVEDCFKCIERYFNRRNANVRGDVERLRDLLKIAHYAQFGYGKLRNLLGIGDVYPEESKPDVVDGQRLAR